MWSVEPKYFKINVGDVYIFVFELRSASVAIMACN